MWAVLMHTGTYTNRLGLLFLSLFVTVSAQPTLGAVKPSLVTVMVVSQMRQVRDREVVCLAESILGFSPKLSGGAFESVFTSFLASPFIPNLHYYLWHLRRYKVLFFISNKDRITGNEFKSHSKE